MIQNVVLLINVLMSNTANLAQCLFRHDAVSAQSFPAVLNLLTQASYPYLEELIHVAAKNAAKNQPVNQWMGGIKRLLQHPIIKLKLAQFSVEVVFTGVQVDHFTHRRNFYRSGYALLPFRGQISEIGRAHV